MKSMGAPNGEIIELSKFLYNEKHDFKITGIKVYTTSNRIRILGLVNYVLSHQDASTFEHNEGKFTGLSIETLEFKYTSAYQERNPIEVEALCIFLAWELLTTFFNKDNPMFIDNAASNFVLTAKIVNKLESLVLLNLESRLANYAHRVRLDIFHMWNQIKGATFSGAYSVIELYLMFFIFYGNTSPEKLYRWRFIPKCTSAPTIYSILSLIGLIDRNALTQYSNEILPGAMSKKSPCVDASMGNLGHSLSIAIGIAQGLLLKGAVTPTVCFLSDGSIQEGVDQSAKLAAKLELSNLAVVLVCNGFQGNYEVTDVDSTMELSATGTLRKQRILWETYGWAVEEINGHDVCAIYKAFNKIGTTSKPLLIMAHTIKGKGLPSGIEGKAGFAHGIKDESLLVKCEHFLTDRLSASPFLLKNNQQTHTKETDKSRPNLRLPSIVLTRYSKTLPHTFMSWLNSFIKRNKGKVFTVNTDCTYLLKGSDDFIRPNCYSSSNFFVGINEPLAVNFSRGLAHEGFFPIFFSPAIHLINVADAWRSVCLDKEKVLMLGYFPGSTLFKFGRTHLAFSDSTIFSNPTGNVFQPATHDDLIFILNEIYKAPSRVLPAYIRLPHCGQEQHKPIAMDNIACIEDGFYEIARETCNQSNINVTLISSGSLLFECLKAVKNLTGKININLINLISLKHINYEAFGKKLEKSKYIFSVIDSDLNNILAILYKSNAYAGQKIVRCFGVDDWGGYINPAAFYKSRMLDAAGIEESIIKELAVEIADKEDIGQARFK